MLNDHCHRVSAHLQSINIIIIIIIIIIIVHYQEEEFCTSSLQYFTSHFYEKSSRWHYTIDTSLSCQRLDSS